MNMTSVFAPIEKSIDQEDGSVLVYGKATDGSLDRDQQRCDPSWLNEAMPAWYRTGGNVREQHDPRRAVGKAIEHEVAEDGHYVTARIVDPVAVAKTRAGVFTGFSIGIRNPKITNTKSADAPNGVISGGEIVELSLCDRPSNPECLITLVKAAKPGMEINAADFDEKRGLVRCQELVEKNHTVVVEDVESQTAEQVEGDRDADDSPTGCDGSCCGDCGAAHALTEELTEQLPGGKGKAAGFDKEAAKALVARVLKANSDSDDDDDDVDMGDVMPPEYEEEQGEIAGAQYAIQCISRLIMHEAEEMCDNPAEDCDIELLMQAVYALRCFIHREQEQAMGFNSVKKPVPVMPLAAEPDVEKAKYNAEQLRAMLKEGKAIRNANGDPSYPIGDKEDLSNAIRAVGRGSGDHDRIRAYIIRRAKALGASNMIPENWTSSGSNKTAEPKVAEKAAVEAAETEVHVSVDGEPVEKAVEPEATKAAVVEAVDPEAIVKALAAALDKSDNPLRKSFEAMIEAATEDTAKSVSTLTERLSKVEAMAAPGGPALRRTDTERKEARKADLMSEAARYKSLSQSAEDLDLRRGYAAKAAQLEAELKALVA